MCNIFQPILDLKVVHCTFHVMSYIFFLLVYLFIVSVNFSHVHVLYSFILPIRCFRHMNLFVG